MLQYSVKKQNKNNLHALNILSNYLSNVNFYILRILHLYFLLYLFIFLVYAANIMIREQDHSF